MNVTYGNGFAMTRPGALLILKDGEVTFNVPDQSPAAIRAQIRSLTSTLLGLPAGEQRDFPVEHTLIDGVYTRTLYVPKGSLLVGKIHRKECVNVVAKGDISILTETGMGRFQAGHVAVSKAGIQKVGYAHQDTVFINVFRTDETDISKIEAEVATTEYTEDLPCQ